MTTPGGLGLPTKQESEPIDPGEWFVRLIWRDFHDPDRVPIISPRSFRPRKDQLDGLSVFRASCLADPIDALQVIHPDKRSDYAVTLVALATLQGLGLSVRPDHIETLPGHVVIPEINAPAYKRDKNAFAAILDALARAASEQIVRRPLA